MKQFVPMTDEMLFDAQNFVGPFVPYQCGVVCAHQAREKIETQLPPKEISAPPSAHRPA